MRNQIFMAIVLFILVFAFSGQAIAAGDSETKMIEEMKQSIVYIKISVYGYEQIQPWRHKDLKENWGSGCAVGKYEVLTPAWNIENAAFIKVLRYGQNEFVDAKIKVVDYESNLCLIELDPNTMGEPLKPVTFSEEYKKGTEVNSYWLSSGNRLESGRGYIDRTKVSRTSTSHEEYLEYVAANVSSGSGRGQVYCIDSNAIGISCWYSQDRKEAGIIPAERINKFLAETAKDKYSGFGAVGFSTSALIDPAMRSFLKIPATMKGGVYVSDVYTIGTGSDILVKGDVIMKIDGHSLNSYGRYIHSKYDRVELSNLITNKAVGDKVSFEIWRNGEKAEVQAEVKNFKASEMLVPYYEYDQQPEYVVTGGFVLQKLTCEYMRAWGEDWAGKVQPHLYHYYNDFAFKPTAEREDIVILSYVLPANINLGYQQLRQIVVKKFNGMVIRSIEDIPAAQKLNPDSKYDVIEFELDEPAVVIDRAQLGATDNLISRNYGVSKLVNLRPQ